MNIDATFKSDAQLAEGGQPGVRALDHPAVAPEPVIALDTSTGDAIPNAAALEMATAACKVVALVGMQLDGPAQWSAALAAHRWQGINQFLEDDRIMAIGPGDTEHQRDALAVRDEVALAAEFAAVRGVGACVRAPRGLGTLAPSTQARLKSSWPAPRNSASNNKCRRCHTPAACQSRSLRQQVMPLPKPNSWGRSSHGMPVRSTKRMPASASSSSSRGLPPLGERGTSGSNGLSLFHSAALISLLLFLAMPRQTPVVRLEMTGFC